MGIKTTRILRWFRNSWEKCEKFANKKVTAKKNVKNQRFSPSILLTCKSVWQIAFSGRIFSWLLYRFENSVKVLRILILICQKRTKKFWGHWVPIWVYVRTSRMQIRKKWLNQLKNFFNKHFWEYYLASFCWWISSRCENYCTLLYMHKNSTAAYPVQA